MLDNDVLNIYKLFIKKRKRSNGIFIFLNILAFFIAGAVTILNLYAIRKNPAQGDKTIILLFVITSILSSFGVVVSALMSFFVFRKRSKIAKEKAEAIVHERNMWKKKEEIYININRNQILIDRVLKIIE